MNTRRMAARRLEEERMNEEIPCQVEHVPKDGGEDPQEFLDAVYMVLSAMGVTPQEKEELPSYQLRVSKIWYTQWKDNRKEESGPIEWKEFKEDFLARLIVYAQLVEESKLKRMARSLKRSGANDQAQTRFKKRAENQEESKSARVKFERGGGFQKIKPICSKCSKKYYGECLLGTGSCFGCGKEGHKVIDCPKDDALTKRCFDALRYRGEKSDESDDDVCKFSLSC
ncbi:hypothetical protein EJD97_011157 [Solanum chilense]|uniref:CCHC-type domain-containing protein n=1 Tax=Solanum chilense TaxID=4083 RepID=A0A6N2BFG4_SOLCI|nr:hypothetical protein EJD97_011157 [Solanum chilense]